MYCNALHTILLFPLHSFYCNVLYYYIKCIAMHCYTISYTLYQWRSKGGEGGGPPRAALLALLGGGKIGEEKNKAGKKRSSKT